MAAEDNGVINRCVNLFLKVRIGFNELRQTGQHSPLPQTTFPGSFPHASQVLYQILQLEQAQDFWAQDFRTHQWPCHWPTRGSLVDSQGSRGQAASQDPGKLLWPRSLHLRRKGNVAVSWHHMCSLLLHFLKIKHTIWKFLTKDTETTTTKKAKEWLTDKSEHWLPLLVAPEGQGTNNMQFLNLEVDIWNAVCCRYDTFPNLPLCK